MSAQEIARDLATKVLERRHALEKQYDRLMGPGGVVDLTEAAARRQPPVQVVALPEQRVAEPIVSDVDELGSLEGPVAGDVWMMALEECAPGDLDRLSPQSRIMNCR